MGSPTVRFLNEACRTTLAAVRGILCLPSVKSVALVFGSAQGSWWEGQRGLWKDDVLEGWGT